MGVSVRRCLVRDHVGRGAVAESLSVVCPCACASVRLRALVCLRLCLCLPCPVPFLPSGGFDGLIDESREGSLRCPERGALLLEGGQ